jgi:hypothetical protein
MKSLVFAYGLLKGNADPSISCMGGVTHSYRAEWEKTQRIKTDDRGYHRDLE